MFHQIMYFLNLKDEMTTDAENFVSQTSLLPQQSANSSTGFFPSFLPEEEIQKVIFDTSYLKHLQKKQDEEFQSQASHFASGPALSAPGFPARNLSPSVGQ